MKNFSLLISKIDQTTSNNEKIEALVNYFQEESNEKDKLWTIAIFCNKRPPRGVSSSLLRTWISEWENLPLWLIEDTYHSVGDLAETLSLLWSKQVEKHNQESLSEIIKTIESLKSKEEEDKKKIVLNYWLCLNKEERFVFNKLITGGFRIGVSQATLIKALSIYLDVDEKVIAHRLMGNWTPDTTTWHDMFLNYNPQDNNSKPYPFMLANPLDEESDISNELKNWFFEYKWDGIRAQIICRNNELFIWSRGEELITDKFPEFHYLKENNIDFVLDGEILAYDNKPLNFQLLQTRIGRKNVTKSSMNTCPVAYFSYDLLEYENEDLRQRTFEERRKILDQLYQRLAKKSNLFISEKYQVDTWEEAVELRVKSEANYAEGLMIKHKASMYESGRKAGLWWKWKVDPYTVDAVMIYAQKGHGRRANLFTDFTFAVWTMNEKNERVLIPFTKAYSGLTDKEFEEITSFVRKNTLTKFGPVYSVKPELVFELAFEGIAYSKRHKSGIALRFPRMKNWRKDKKMEEADDLQTLINMIKT